MADHLTPEQLDQYRRGTAPPDQLLALDDHLSQCEQCRMALEKLVTPLALTRWAAGLSRYEQEYEQEDYDKKKDTQPLPAEPASVPRSARWPRLLWIPALAAALVVGVLLWKRPVLPDASKVDAPKQDAVPPPFLAELRDAGGTLQLDAYGVLHAPPAIDQGNQALLAEALKSRALPLAAMPSDLAAPPGTLLGPSKPDDFAPIAPLSTIVYSDRPEFRWQALPGALTYEIQVFDSEFREVDSSGKIRETHWTPVRPLARGALYQWQIIAYQPGDSVRAPTPPSPDARFRVLSADTFTKVEAARAASAHLLAAIFLAKAGMKDAARKEMDAVVVVNPGSALAREMIAGLEH